MYFLKDFTGRRQWPKARFRVSESLGQKFVKQIKFTKCLQKSGTKDDGQWSQRVSTIIIGEDCSVKQHHPQKTLSIHPSIHPFTYPSLYLFIHPSIHLSVYLCSSSSRIRLSLYPFTQQIPTEGLPDTTEARDGAQSQRNMKHSSLRFLGPREIYLLSVPPLPYL